MGLDVGLGPEGVGAFEPLALVFVGVLAFAGTVKLFVFGERRTRFLSGGEASFFGVSCVKLNQGVDDKYLMSNLLLLQARLSSVS